MKWNKLLLALLIALGVPYLCGRILEQRKPPIVIETQPSAPEPTQAAELVNVLKADGIVQLPLEDYVVGVLLGEMPASFHTEALKAQAVAVRTYTVKNRKHPTADVCCDPACCQAFVDASTYTNADSLERIQQAVRETEGQVLLYDGQLIDATYFSCSGGRTEDAVAVWGTQVPYLQSVESPGEEGAAHFVDTVQFSVSEFAERLGLTDRPSIWLGQTAYTQGGGVETMEIGGVAFTGVQLRQLLGLRSTAISIAIVGDTVTVTTRGFGHRVGMSQYGADAMAQGGADYRQILAHYYPGTVIDKAVDF